MPVWERELERVEQLLARKPAVPVPPTRVTRLADAIALATDVFPIGAGWRRVARSEVEGSSSTPLTHATFDWGMAVVDSTRVGLVVTTGED